MVMTDGLGDAVIEFLVGAPPGSFVTATATNPNGSTSEFSNCVPVT